VGEVAAGEGGPHGRGEFHVTCLADLWASPARPDTGLGCVLVVPELVELSG
jgi:hypothetical protein